MKESQFQAQLKRKIKSMFPGCILMKEDASQIQGVPDLIILYRDKYALLECKKSATASHRPNQDYYINEFGKYTFTSFIFPENEQEILSQLQAFFQGG